MNNATLAALVLSGYGCLGMALVLLWKANARLVWERTELQLAILREKQLTGSLVNTIRAAEDTIARRAGL